jgi:hypothetical protein
VTSIGMSKDPSSQGWRSTMSGTLT